MASWSLLVLALLCLAQAIALALVWRRLTSARRAVLALACLLALVAAVGALGDLSRFLLARAGAVDAAGYARLRVWPALAFAVVFVLAARIPWRGWWWLLVLAPVASFFLVPPGRSPMYMDAGHVEQVRMPLAALLAAALGPHALSRAPAPPWRARSVAPLVAAALASFLLVAAVASGGGLFALTMDRTDGPARHTWRIEVAPASSGAAFHVELPLLVSRDGRSGSVDALLATLRVVEGKGTFGIDAARGLLSLQGTGAVALLAEREFYGTSEHREGFARVSTADAANLGETSVRVLYAGDFSGGRGHTCWSSGQESFTLDPGETRALFVERTTIGWPHSGVCA